MRDRRWLMIASILCVSVIVLFLTGNVFNNRILVADPAQGRNSDEPIPELRPGVKEITVQVSMDEKEFAVLKQLRQQYQSIHTDLSINLENIPNQDEAYTKWKKASQLGEAPDIMLLDNNWVTEFAALGYLLPVDSFLTSELIALQMEQAVSQVKWNGYTWGVPKDVDTYLMVYSAKRLAELGFEKPPAQAEELISLHTSSSKPDEGKYGIYIDFEDPVAFLSLAKSLGGAKAQGKTAPLKLTESGVTKAFDALLAAPRDTGKEDTKWLVKSFPSISTPTWKPWDLLHQGRMSGMLTTLSEYKLYGKDREGLIMTGLPFPKGEAIWKSSWLNGRSFSISSRSDFPQEAFEWIKDLTNTASNLKFWIEGYKLPSTTNSYLIGGIKNDTSVQSVAAFLDKDEATVKSPVYNRQLQQLENGLDRLRKGEISWKMFSEQIELQWGGGAVSGAASNTTAAGSSNELSSAAPVPSAAPKN